MPQGSVNINPLADGQLGALGDGARLQADAAGVLDEVAVEAWDTEVVPTLTAAPTDGLGAEFTVADPDLKLQVPSVFVAPSSGSAPVYVYVKEVQPAVESQMVIQEAMPSERYVPAITDPPPRSKPQYT